MVPGAGGQTPSPHPPWLSWLRASSHSSFDEAGVAPGREGWAAQGLPDTPPAPCTWPRDPGALGRCLVPELALRTHGAWPLAHSVSSIPDEHGWAQNPVSDLAFAQVAPSAWNTLLHWENSNSSSSPGPLA